MDLLRCHKCNITFTSSLLLEKHKEKFCIGGDFGKSRRTGTPNDTAERAAGFRRRGGEQEGQHQSPVRELLLGLHNLDIGPRHPALETVSVRKSNSEPAGRRSKAARTQEQDTKLRDLAELHKKQVAELAKENRKLEEQRRDIDLKLQGLVAQTKGVSLIEKMLHELKAQEERNTHLLESLVEQMQQMKTDSMRDGNHSDSRLYSAKKKKEPFLSHVPVYGGGGLSSEIRALRLSYLQGGGNDHLILAQLHDLLDEALRVEMLNGRQPRAQHQGRSKRGQDTVKQHVNRDLVATEMEHQHLEEETMRAQIWKQRDSRFIRRAYNGRRSEQKTKDGTDVDPWRNEIDTNGLRRQRKTVTSPAPASPFLPLAQEELTWQTHTLAKRFLESSDGFGPAPYDPLAGFVVFYDFLLGLGPLYSTCRLVVGLYSGDQEMGTPSSLPTVYCEPASLSARVPNHKRGNLATLAAEQSVPRVLPSPTISLVVELQASGGYDHYGQEVEHLVSRGWAKIDIFDGHNQVVSGKWKVPVRVLPIKPSLTTGELNAIPQLDNTVLYIRIVNARNAEDQSSAPISHSNARLYRYPALVREQAFQ